MGAGAPALGAAAAGVGVPALAVGSFGVGAPALGAAAVLGAAALVLGPQQAWAEPVRQGDFLIESNVPGQSGYSYADGVLTVMDGADIVISMVDGVTAPTSDRIVVAEYAKAAIALNGVYIAGKSEADGVDAVSAVDIANNASLLLQLADNSTNSLMGGNGIGNGAPGIHLPEKAKLAILGSGSLTVAGGTGGYGGTGIGGTNVPGPNLPSESCGTVVILAIGEISISGGESGPGSSPAQDIGAGMAPPWQEGDDGGGIRPTGDGDYVVWGNPALPEHPSSYAIPEDATLTVPGDASLCIPQGVTLTNNGTITGEGNLNGDGILDGDGVVTVLTNNFQKDSALTFTIEGAVQATQTGVYHVPYQSEITLKAEIKRANTRALPAGAYNTVTFYVGDGASKAELGTVGVQGNMANLPLALFGDTWNKGFKVNSNNTITAEFSGHSHLKPATGTVTLRVTKASQNARPSAPAVSQASSITDASVTLETVTGGVAGVEYSCKPSADEQALYSWQDSPTFSSLTPGTAYIFNVRYKENSFYIPSAPSDDLTVITAPADDAVTIDYEKETIAFDDGVLEVNSDKEFSNTPLSNNGTVTSRIGMKIYVRVKSGNDTNAPIRGIAEIDVPIRPASPEDPKVTNVSSADRQDGKILNLTPSTDYQISTDETTWVNRTTDADGVISNLAAGMYKVRTKATPTQFAGVSASVTINVGDAITIIPPDFEPVYVGYDQPAPMRFTILNNSDQDVTLTSLSKTVGETFTVQGSGDLNSVVPAGGSNTSFTVQPGEGWAPGVHTATITAEYGNGQLTEAEVTFTVFPRMYPDIHSEVEREEGDKDWVPTVTYGNELVVNFETSYEAEDSEKEPGEEPGEKTASAPGADEGPEDPPVTPAPVAKGRVSLYLGDTLLAGPVAYEGGDIALTYDTRGRDIPVSEKKQELTVVFEGENAPDETYTAEFKLVKAPATELTVSGDLIEGATLEACFPDARDNAGASFQWLRDGEPIAGATGQRYRLTSEDVGHEVTVRATSPWFEGVSASAALGSKVKPALPSSELPPTGGTDKPTPGAPGEPAPNGGSDGSGNPASGDRDGSGLPSTGDPTVVIGTVALTGALAAAAGTALSRRRNG